MNSFEVRKHQLNLSRLHAECEQNYYRLSKIPLNPTCLGEQICLRCHDKSGSALKIEVIDTAKYTSTLFIEADFCGPKWMPKVEIKARLYRDAKMLEVIEWCNDRTIPWMLSERKGMQARDEKWQWNIFLSELLSYGINHGLSVVKG
ncbi:MAG: DUF1249 domain-containing protein [Porticoccaceae bacterium]|nr:DUF1249 domain-containing protein [Porticoccaceae bacterium]